MSDCDKKCEKEVCVCRISLATSLGALSSHLREDSDLPNEVADALGLVSAAIAGGNEKAVLANVSDSVKGWVHETGLAALKAGAPELKRVVQEAMAEDDFPDMNMGGIFNMGRNQNTNDLPN